MMPLVEAIAVGITLLLLIPVAVVWIVALLIIDRVKHGIVRRNNASKKNL